MRINDTWFGIEGEIDGNPYIIRGREDISSFKIKGLHQTRIDICWSYISEDESKMPDDTQLEMWERVEQLLINQFEHDIEGIMAFVFTGNCQRVWYWYCRDAKIALERISLAFSVFPEMLPIEIYSTQDPDWKEYCDLID